MRQDLLSLLEERHRLVLAASPDISCGDGWFNLLDCLLEALAATSDADSKPIRAESAKSKYGSLRIDWMGRSQNAESLIQMTELISERTCELCGKPGTQVDRAGWISVACDEHNQTNLP